MAASASAGFPAGMPLPLATRSSSAVPFAGNSASRSEIGKAKSIGKALTAEKIYLIFCISDSSMLELLPLLLLWMLLMLFTTPLSDRGPLAAF